MAPVSDSPRRPQHGALWRPIVQLHPGVPGDLLWGVALANAGSGDLSRSALETAEALARTLRRARVTGAEHLRWIIPVQAATPDDQLLDALERHTDPSQRSQTLLMPVGSWRDGLAGRLLPFAELGFGLVSSPGQMADDAERLRLLPRLAAVYIEPDWRTTIEQAGQSSGDALDQLLRMAGGGRPTIWLDGVDTGLQRALVERSGQRLGDQTLLASGHAISLPASWRVLLPGSDPDSRDPGPTASIPAGPRAAEPGDIHCPAPDFAIICMREDEFEAVLERIGQDTGWHQEPGRNTGLMINHCVVSGPGSGSASGSRSRSVAAVRCLEQGTLDAQRMASDLLRELDPHWILVVGSASGVASHQIGPGDVVVSSRIHDFCLEAAAHDGQRTFDIRGGPIDPAVAGVIANLSAMKSALGPWYELGISRPPVLDEFRDGEDAAAIRAALRKRSAGPPHSIVLTRPIASSDRWIDDSELVRTWKQAASTIAAIEMASAGVYRATQGRKPFLAIRGIGDVIGVSRVAASNPAWTHYACHAAAAFTRALIQAWPLDRD